MSDRAGGPGPPRWLELPLRLVLGDGVRARSIRGDLREEYVLELRARGRVAAVWWYARQAAGVAARSAAVRSASALGLAAGRRAAEPASYERDGLWSSGGGVMGGLIRGVGHSLRSLLRSPGFTVVVVLTIALGIGANTAIFTVVDRVLLRPLPIADQDRVVRVYTSDYDSGPYGSTSYPDFESFRASSSALAELAAFSYPLGVNVAVSGAAERLTGLLVTPSYWEVLGVVAGAGRLFGPGDAESPVLVLSHGAWQRRYGGDPDLLGRTVQLNGSPFTVVGIAPEGFAGLEVGARPDVFVPVRQVGVVLPRPGGDPAAILDRRGTRWLDMVGRLAPGATLAQARDEVNTIMARLAGTFPGTNLGTRDRPDEPRPMAVVPVRRGAVGAQVFDRAVDVAWLLLAIVGLVLLIACANVANLLFVRGDRRRREIAVRTALGASRRRLIGRQLTESMLLALAGGVAGVALAYGGTQALLAFGLEPVIGNYVELGGLATDGRVLLFTLALSLVTGLLFGALPAVRASKPDLVPALKETRTTVGGAVARLGLRDGLVVLQIAVSLVLLVGAGLFVRSALDAYAVELGFEPDGVAAAAVNLLPEALTPAEGLAFYGGVRERLAGMPGVESAALAVAVPVDPRGIRRSYQIEGVESPGGATGQPGGLEININMVTPGFFETLRIPVLRGRALGERDGPEAPPVAVVNQAFADRFWPGEDPIGKGIRRPGSEEWTRVVGVVGTGRYRAVREDPLPYIYLPLMQDYVFRAEIVARTDGRAETLIPQLRAAVREIRPSLPVTNARTLRDQLDTALAQERSLALLLGLMAGLALVLAAVGLYGLMAYSVTQRTHEIGVRAALGASKRAVLLGVLRRGIALAVVGLTVGLVAALGLNRLVAGFIAGIATTDAVTYVVVTAVLAAVVAAASLIPAWQATRVDPMIALRAE